MKPHPSVSTPFVAPKPLPPQREMQRNANCWCGSGLKWKKCHRDRELQTPINVFELGDAMTERFERGYCSHPLKGSGNCSSGIIASHTIQRRGGLSLIQEEGHVLATKPTFQSTFKNKGRPVPRRVGVNKASTFPGFCNKHDTELFRPIENTDTALNPLAAFLYSYRAIAYERFTKDAALEIVSLQRQTDRGRPFETQVNIQEYLHVYSEGLKRGMADVEDWKQVYDERLLSGAFEDFNFYGIIFDRVLPIVACAALHVEF